MLEGISLALVFTRSTTTGGSDLVSRLIQLKYPHFSVGRLLLMIDGVVLVASAIVYQNIENALYGLIVIFTSTRVIDSILYGLDAGKVMLIISERYTEIAGRIGEELERGCTFLEGRGSYTQKSRPVMLCAVRKAQFVEVKKIVRAVDPGAFMLALEANEIIGEGFKDIARE